MHLLYGTDHRIDDYLVKALREAGHVVEALDQPADALVVAATGDYQAIVLDWTASPAACVARFSAAAPRSLIMVIAGAVQEAERARILKTGADAYFSRPASFIELEARLEALGRLVQRARPGGDAEIELARAERGVRLGGRLTPLSPREFQVIEQLIAHSGEVVSIDRLQQHVWGDAAEPRPDVVQACLSRLRRKLEAAGVGDCLRVVSGHGYVFRAPSGLWASAEAEHENRLI